MRKGVAGVRLCDQNGCGLRWPCERHGTLMVAAAPAERAPTRLYCADGQWRLGNEGTADFISCEDCGYVRCCCCDTPEPEEDDEDSCAETDLSTAPPAVNGWERVEHHRPGLYYRHRSGARVWRPDGMPKWCWADEHGCCYDEEAVESAPLACLMAESAQSELASLPEGWKGMGARSYMHVSGAMVQHASAGRYLFALPNAQNKYRFRDDWVAGTLNEAFWKAGVAASESLAAQPKPSAAPEGHWQLMPGESVYLGGLLYTNVNEHDPLYIRRC